MTKAIAKKPSPDHHNKRKQDAPYWAFRSSHAVHSNSYVPTLQLKPICPCDGGCPRCAGVIQPKLTIGQPNDIYEQEADRVADMVMRMPEPGCPECPEKEEEEELIQTKPISPKITPLIQRQVMEEEEIVQPKPLHFQSLRKTESTIPSPLIGELSSSPSPLVGEGKGEGEATPNIETQINAMRGSGQPLPESTRAFFESLFGRDFSRLRIHSNPEAARMARVLNAKAFTVSRDIVFAAGQYEPEISSGRQLLAHELVHTIQQNEPTHSAQTTLQKVDGAPTHSTGESSSEEAAEGSSTPTPAYGNVCTSGPSDPCQYSRCTDHESIGADIDRAIDYVNQSITAITSSTLSTSTEQALDWYFNDHRPDTVDEVNRRLRCILECLEDTRRNNRYGCHPGYDANAYVCGVDVAICEHAMVKICFTDSHMGNSERVRGSTVIHECAHRIGMSLRRRNLPDIYDHTSRFLYMDTEESLRNSDSFALFAAAIASGIRPNVLFPIIGVTGGAAIPETGAATWQTRLYYGAELQHPVLGMFNPTLGIGLGLIGESATEGPVPALTELSGLISLLAGVRIADPRPGAGGGGYASFFGGPALAFSDIEVGAEVGMALGYRWRWLDFSVGIGYTYDPTREAHMEHLVTLSASVSFIPVNLEL